MEISYRRDMKRTYMMVEMDENDDDLLASRMLAENTIGGLLKFHIRKFDDCCQFCYEITSMQPLKRLLETRSIGEKGIKTLLLGIARALTSMEDYLLSEDEVLLDPEYIYVDPDDFYPGLCLIPGRAGDFPKELSSLLQFLLEKTDHQDKEAVVLIYGLYRESLKENYGLEDLMKWLMREDLAVERETFDPAAEMRVEEELFPEYEDEKTAPSLFETFEIFLNGIKERFKKPETYKEPRAHKELTEMADPDSSWEKIFLPDIQEFPTDAAEAEDMPERMNEKPREICCLVSEDLRAESIAIYYVPFLIGTQKELVDHVLNAEGVNRLHIRIDQKGESFYLTDLNSSNGTLINDKIIEANETVELHQDDKIRISGMRFCFKKP